MIKVPGADIFLCHQNGVLLKNILGLVVHLPEPQVNLT